MWVSRWVQGLINLQTHPENIRKSKSPLHPDAHMEYISQKTDLTYSRSHKTLNETRNGESRHVSRFLGIYNIKRLWKQCGHGVKKIQRFCTSFISPVIWNKLTEVYMEGPLKKFWLRLCPCMCLRITTAPTNIYINIDVKHKAIRSFVMLETFGYKYSCKFAENILLIHLLKDVSVTLLTIISKVDEGHNGCWRHYSCMNKINEAQQ